MAVTAATFTVNVSNLELMSEKQLRELKETIEKGIWHELYFLHPAITASIEITSIYGVLIGDPTD